MRLLVIISVLILVGSFSGCVANKGYVKTSLRQDSIQLICEGRNIPWQWDSISQVFTFTSRGIGAKILVGSKLVLIGSERVILDSAIQRRGNSIVVPPDFIAKVFERTDAAVTVLTPAPSLAGKYRTIMVDAGHGGKDPGAIGISGAIEKDIVFDIARRLKKALQEMGFEVLMTRDSDEFISLQRRAQMASQSDADIFVSIHANAARSRKIRGLEVYYSRALDPASDLSYYRANERTFFDRMDIYGDKEVPQNIISDMIYERKQQESVMLAEQMIRKTSKNVNALNRGSRKSGFFVVKNTLIPAILFEVGYVSNASEAKLLQIEEYRQKIADSIAESIREYSHET